MSTDAIIELLYKDLHRIARRERFRVGQPQTLQTTAVLHEAYIRLRKRGEWESDSHFMGTAATVMRHVLIDAARERQASKRSCGVQPPSSQETVPTADETQDLRLLELGDALDRLAKVDSQLSKLIDCRFFAGMNEDEVGEVMGLSVRTVRRRWALARGWMQRELSAD